MTNRMVTSPVVWVGVIVGALTGIATYAGGSTLLPAALAGLFPVGYGVAVTLLARWSPVSSVLAGRPMDERWEHIGMEAAALALGISAVTVLGAFVVTLATNGAWQPYALTCAVIAIGYAISLVVVQSRH